MTVVAAAQITVTTAAGGTKIVAAIPNGQSVLITNRDATNSVFVGPQGVTTTSGAEIKPGASWANAFNDLPPETELWAIAGAGTPRVDVSQIIAS
jgi:hypothetical protein